MKQPKFGNVIATVLVCLFASVVTYAQSDTAQISGFVKDPSGAVVPGAQVTLTNEATTGVERKTTTNGSGYYIVPNLPPGFYTLTVETPGFKRFVKSQNRLNANISMRVDATLQVGEVTQTIEVTAPPVALQSESAAVGGVVQTKQIDNLILNGRDAISLAQLKAGVSGGPIGFNFGKHWGTFHINGGRSQDSVITYDGAVADRTRGNGGTIGNPDLDTVQEIQVLTASYSAEYGRSSAGQIRMVTKSGTRNFHGNVYDYFRNDKLDANSWSNNQGGVSRNSRRFNQFGYNVSGPVFIPGKFNTGKNKLFWLLGQEWVRQRQVDTAIITVPSLAMRGGDFSGLLNPSNSFFGSTRVVNDPDSGLPFPNNVIPADRLSSNGLGFLNSYPESTAGFLQGTNNQFETGAHPTNQRKDTLSIDFIPVDKHTFRFRLQNFDYVSTGAFRSGTNRAASRAHFFDRVYTLNYIFTINPTTVNEFMGSVSYDRVKITVPNKQGFADRSRYGINYPYIFPEHKEIFDKIPTIGISNFATVDGGPYPSSSAGPIYQISDHITKIMSNHTLKFGVRYERTGQNDFDQINVSGVPGGTNNQNGRFIFDDARAGALTTGLAVANAAMGLFTSYAEIGTRAYTPYRSNMFEWFAQDSWKVTSKLHLEFGVRHTVVQPYYYSLWRNIAVFDPNRYDPSKAVVQDPATGNILSGDRFNGVVIPGKSWPDAARGRVPIADSGQFDRLFSGGSKTWGKTQWGNFQPRVGLAYRFDNKTVVRAGGGRYFARPAISDNIFLGGNPPFQPMVSIADGSADNPGSGNRTGFPQFFMTTDPVFKIPSAWNWNVAVERELPSNTTVTVAYVGRVGLNMERVRDINQLQPGTLQDPANQGINANVLRPYKGFAAINLGENAARSTYRSLQISVNRNFSHGLLFGVAYTYSSSHDNASGRRDQIYNNYNDRNFWGWSSFDRRHVLISNFVYQLPGFNYHSSFVPSLILSGWQMSGIIQFETGTPFTIGTSDDLAGIGVSNFQPWEVNGNLKLSSGNRVFSQGAGDNNFYFRTTDANGDPLVVKPAPGTFSKTQNRNSLLHGPGFQTWNIGLFKDFTIHESQKMQFRAEFYNLPNHPNWGNPNRDPTSSTFGTVTSKGGNRNIQLSLRYMF